MWPQNQRGISCLSDGWKEYVGFYDLFISGHIKKHFKWFNKCKSLVAQCVENRMNILNKLFSQEYYSERQWIILKKIISNTAILMQRKKMSAWTRQEHEERPVVKEGYGVQNVHHMLI